MRRDLLRLSSFTTLLLTATLTESCLDTLKTFLREAPLDAWVQMCPYFDLGDLILYIDYGRGEI